MGLFSRIGGYFGAGKAEKSNQEELAKAQELWKKLKTPTVDQLVGGELKSSYANEDPRLKDYQMSVIQSLQDLYQGGGIDARSAANLDTIRRNEDRRMRGNREALLQNQRSRGIQGGSLVDQILNANASADRRSAENMQVFADNEGRAIDALLNSAELSGNVRGQDFNKMAALDRIAEFNNRNRSNAVQQEFQNRYGVTGKRSDLYKDFGTSRRDQGDRNFDFGAGIIGGAGKLLGKYGGKALQGVGKVASAAGREGSSFEFDGGSGGGTLGDFPSSPVSGGDAMALRRKTNAPRFRKYG